MVGGFQNQTCIEDLNRYEHQRAGKQMFSKIEGDENLLKCLGSTTSDKSASENSTYLGCKK